MSNKKRFEDDCYLKITFDAYIIKPVLGLLVSTSHILFPEVECIKLYFFTAGISKSKDWNVFFFWLHRITPSYRSAFYVCVTFLISIHRRLWNKNKIRQFSTLSNWTQGQKMYLRKTVNSPQTELFLKERFSSIDHGKVERILKAMLFFYFFFKRGEVKRILKKCFLIRVYNATSNQPGGHEY